MMCTLYKVHALMFRYPFVIECLQCAPMMSACVQIQRNSETHGEGSTTPRAQRVPACCCHLAPILSTRRARYSLVRREHGEGHEYNGPRLYAFFARRDPTAPTACPLAFHRLLFAPSHHHCSFLRTDLQGTLPLGQPLAQRECW